MEEKIVYIISDRFALVAERLREQGFRVEVGDNTLDDALLANCWALLPGRSFVTEEVLDKAPHLKLVCKQGVGVERIDVAACTKRGICVANTPHANYISVAEHTFALMLAAAKRIYPLSRRLRWDQASDAFEKNPSAMELMGKTLSIIGLGSIGMRVAAIAQGFDMDVVAYVRNPEGRQIPDYITLAVSMDEAVQRADFLSLHVSGTPENRGLIGKRELALMKPGAVLINTTRGLVVDEAALYEALKNGQIAAAGLDVFESEPVKPEDPLLTLNNLVATPHTGASTREASRRAFLECAKIVTDFAAGVRPVSAVNEYAQHE